MKAALERRVEVKRGKLWCYDKDIALSQWSVIGPFQTVLENTAHRLTWNSVEETFCMRYLQEWSHPSVEKVCHASFLRDDFSSCLPQARVSDEGSK